MRIAIPVPDDASVDTILSRADMADEKPFLVLHVWDWDGFNAQENEYLVEGRKIRDEVGEDCRDSRNEFRVYEADASDTYDSQIGSQSEEPVYRDLVLDIELVRLQCPIMPRAHHHHEYEREDYRDPRSF